MRTRVASDKIVIYFAKHTSIGSLVVAKEVLKNIDRLNRSVFSSANPS
jgi:Flp pilus assembly CpaE family ATPase